eukprot:XP_016858497.1 uncharacterized protein LOC107984841 [Homo sapiens]
MPVEAYVLRAWGCYKLTTAAVKMTLKNGVGWFLSNALEQRSPTTGPQSWSWIYHERLVNPGRETDWATCYSGGTIQLQENKLNTPTDSTLCSYLPAASPGPELSPVSLYRPSS